MIFCIFLSIIFLLVFLYRKNLDHSRFIYKLVARSGFEPETLWLKVKCSTYWASEPKKEWLPRVGSNHRNVRVKVWCLTTWLRGNILFFLFRTIFNGGGTWIWTMEPEGTDLQSAAFDHFAISPKKWCRQRESNSQPTDYKSVALPVTLCRHYK